MKLNKKIFTALLLAMGLLFHQISPGLFMGMRFDFLLIFMFIAMLLDDSLENILIVGILGGILSAITTTSPGGQIANMVDKIITSFFIYFMLKGIKNRNSRLTIGLLGAIGTIVSGSIFLSISVYILGVDLDLMKLIGMVVIPTAIINGFGTVFLYGIVTKTMGMLKIN